MNSLLIGDISIEVILKNIKNIHLSVHPPNGRVRLAAPKSKQRLELANNSYINLYVRKDSTKEKRENIMNEWYRGELKLQIPKYIEKWEPIMNVSVNEWNVRRMKTKWGSCNIGEKKILINLELAKKNPRGLEYIVVHEMVHLLERNHNDKFKAYMDRFLPNWRAIKNEINGMV